MRRRIGLLSVSLCLAPLLATGRAAASDPLPQSAARIDAPGRNTASEDGAEALRLNPGNLGFLPAWEARFTGTWCSDTVKVNCGYALEAATPLPFGLSTGLRLDFVTPSSTSPFPFGGDYTWITWGVGWKIADWLGVGMSVQHSYSVNAYQNDLWGVTAGVSFRPSTHLALAFVAQDFNGPSTVELPPFSQAVLDRSYVLSAAFRPTGRRGFEIGLDLLCEQGTDLGCFNDGLIPRATLAFDIPGVGRARGDVQIDHLANDTQRGVVGTVGLEIALAGFSAGGGAMFGSGLGSSSSVGEYATASISGYKNPGIPLPSRAVAIRIDQTPDARGHIALMRRLWKIAKERETVAVALELHAEPADSLAHAEELADAIRVLRSRGKKVLCSWEDAGSRSLYVCANADRTVVAPGGGLRYAGLKQQYIYLGGLLKKLGVNAEIIRVGPHKSAGEQFTNEHAGPVAQADHVAFLNETEAVFTKDVSTGRQLHRKDMTIDRVRQVTAAGPFTADEAVSAGFADGTAFNDEIERVTAELVGHAVRLVPYEDDTKAPPQFGSPAKIAIVVVEGDMVDGQSSKIPLIGMTLVGSKDVEETLQRVMNDSSIASVVLRVESPGGSTVAADVMWRAVERLERVKPVIVSMGTYAASGGYYLSAPARTIYALPLTVTGSIGVFAGKADLSGLLHKIGVNVDTDKTTPHADMESMFRPLTADETAIMQAKIEELYDTFLDRVSRGRHMTKAAVDAIGRGHVWTGQEAYRLGLVDKLGGLRHALEEARKVAGLPEDAPIVELPAVAPSLLDKAKAAVTLLSRSSADETLLEALPEQVKALARAVGPMVVHAPYAPLARLEWVSVGQ